MKCEVLVSTMNNLTKKQVINDIRINDCVIINQITKNIGKVESDCVDNKQKFLSFYEKGLSKSRNKALSNSTKDICIISDDDMFYVDDYEKIILEAYNNHPDADIIAFIVDRENKKYKAKIKAEKRISWLKSMKLSSVQLTFKRNSIIENKIHFDERFGAGSIYPWGEENIFLFDCLRKGLKIYYVPIKIATLYDTDESTWDKKNDEKHYNNQGAIYYRMSSKFYWVLIIQFALRKRRIYAKDISTIKVIKAMFIGAKKFKNGVTI